MVSAHEIANTRPHEQRQTRYDKNHRPGRSGPSRLILLRCRWLHNAWHRRRQRHTSSLHRRDRHDRRRRLSGISVNLSLARSAVGRRCFATRFGRTQHGHGLDDVEALDRRRTLLRPGFDRVRGRLTREYRIHRQPLSLHRCQTWRAFVRRRPLTGKVLEYVARSGRVLFLDRRCELSVKFFELEHHFTQFSVLHLFCRDWSSWWRTGVTA